jgi:hypothetical protein
MREINTSIVLAIVREHRTISRVDIARLASLSAATASRTGGPPGARARADSISTRRMSSAESA